MDDGDLDGIRQAYQTARHRVREVESGHEAENPGQQWITRFDGRGFTTVPDSGGWQWGMELVSYGFSGSSQEIAGKPEIRSAQQRLEYVWNAGLTEWYVNDQRGLEHGFTVAEPPAGKKQLKAGHPEHGPSHPAASLLEFRFRIRGRLVPEVAADRLGVGFREPGGSSVLNYSGLRVWDADGRALPCYFQTDGSALTLVVDETKARYPIIIDPIAQQAYLKASNTGAEDLFGGSVAVSGQTVVIGAHQEDSSARGVNGNQANNTAGDAGAAYVFVRTGATWTQQAYLKASNGALGDQFGCAVALSGDTLVVGAQGEDSDATTVNGNQANNNADLRGAAYVFTRSGSTWTQQAYLKPGYASSFFGAAVSVTGDTVVVGAPSDYSSSTGINNPPTGVIAQNSGAAYVFSRSGTMWTQQAYLKASNTAALDLFGTSVSAEGDTIVVGAPREGSAATGVNGDQADDSAGVSGAAYIFFRTGSTWVQQAYLKASNTRFFDSFGTCVGVSGDTVVVGAPRESSPGRGVNGDQTNNAARDTGAAYVFARNGTTWAQQAYLKASNASGLFGTSAAISGDTLVIGAPNEDTNSTGVNGNQSDESFIPTGAAYAFVRTGGVWSQIAYLKAGNTGFSDEFGRSVAVAGDLVVVGAPMEDSSAVGVDNNGANDGSADAGAAYLFAGFADRTPEISVAGDAEIADGGAADFGIVPKGTRGSPLSFTVRNAGSADLTGLAVAKDGLHPDDFMVSSLGKTTLRPGESLALTITFSPTGQGPRSCDLHLSSNDADESPYDLRLTGIGEPVTALPLGAPLGLKGSPMSAGNFFGYSLAISGDIMVVGAPWNSDGVQAGGAYVFVRSGGGWEQQAYLEPTKTHVSTSFGTSVSVSGDTVVVGAPREGLFDTDAQGNPVGTPDPLRSGAVYVFSRTGKNWLLQAHLKPAASQRGQAFGKSVGISGGTLVTGIDAAVGTEQNAGAVHVLTRTGTTWTPQAALTASTPIANAYFGASVAIDGDDVVVGAPREWSVGAVYVFNRSGAAWSQQAALKADGVPYPASFGYAVGLSGGTVIVGAPDEGVATVTPSGTPRALSSAGASYIFVRNGSTWALQTRLLASNPDEQDNFGFSVAIAGNAVVIGAYEESSNATGVNGDQTNNSVLRAGAAYALTRFGSTWTPQAYLKAGFPHVEDLFGHSVGVSGGTVVVGAPLEDSRGYDAAGNDTLEPATNSGMVHVFDAPVATPRPEISFLSGINLADGDSADLGAVAIGAVSRTRRFTVSNSGPASLTGLTFAISGANPGDFSITPPGSSSIAPSGNLSFEISFTPGAAGPREALLQCFSNDEDESPFDIRLTGTGTSGAPLTRALTAYLKASNAGAGDNFGEAVAVFGNTVVVGAPHEGSRATGVNGDGADQGAPFSGAAYIFTHQSGGWTQEAYLKSSNTTDRDLFGSTVAVSGDTVVVGAPRESERFNDSGAAYVFVRSGTTWTQQAYLKAGNAGFFDLFGTAVAITGDTLVVGAVGEGSGPPGTVTPEDDPTYSFSGAAYVFTRTGGIWTQEAMLKANNAANQHQLGNSVAVSGNTVIAGAPYEGNSGGFSEGAAYVFTRTGTLWTQQSRLKMGTPAFNPRFGWSVGLDGDLAVIGAPEEASKGTAYVFRRSGGSWSSPSRLLPLNPTTFQGFGQSVAVSGESILVGARFEDSSATGIDGPPDLGSKDSGAAYLFTQQAGEWVQQNFLKAGNTGEGDRFGTALAIHGNTIIAGAPFEDSGGGLNPNGADNSAADAGAAYLFTVLTPPGILLTGNSREITHADATPDLEDHTDFGGTAFTGGVIRRSFTLTNTGMVDLIPGSIVLGGLHSADFLLAGPPAGAVRPGAPVVFEILFDPAAIGLRQAVVSFTSNAVDKTPFSFAIQGTGLNTAPQADGQDAGMLEDTPLILTLTGQDADPQSLTFRISHPPSHGKLSGTGPSVTYTPDLNYSGPDTFSFVANDGLGDSLPARVTLEIIPVNDAPAVTRQPDDIMHIRPGLSTRQDLAVSFGDVETAASGLTYSVNQAGAPGFYRTVLEGSQLSLEGLAAGTGEITVRAADREGLFAQSTFRFTVKHLPELISPIPDQRVIIGQPLTLEAEAFFTDRDADMLFFSSSAGSPTPAASAVFTGSSLLLTALAPGVTAITVQTMDIDGNVVTDTFSISSGTEFPMVLGGQPDMERQTGLYVQSVQITNTTGLVSEGFRLRVGGLPAGVTLYNSAAPLGASGAWIDYRAPTAPGAAVTLTLTYYVPGRVPAFTPLLTMEPLPPVGAAAGGYPPIAVERLLRLADGSMMIEFSSTAGRIYQVQYSNDLNAWQTSPASLRAGANRVQWIDRGPPDTQLLPGRSTARYYRVQDITPAAP